MQRCPIHIARTVRASHLLLTGYAHWLPNDPRGSGSEVVGKLGLSQLGPIHFGRRRIQPPREVLRQFHRPAQPLLKHLVVWFDAPVRRFIADAIHLLVHERGWTVYACALLRNHAHLVIRTHKDDSLTMLTHLAQRTHDALHDARIVPEDHPVWADRPYKVYLKTNVEIRSRIRYVEENPIKEGLARQHYPFIIEFAG
jgi:REP element-mobilizing transposase RayT